jgi:hypothetical protein
MTKAISTGAVRTGGDNASVIYGIRYGSGWSQWKHQIIQRSARSEACLPQGIGWTGWRCDEFAAGYAACFENALLRVARQRKQPIRESSITANVAIGRNDQGFFELAVGLEVSVPDRDKAEIQELANIAHAEVCPYSRATVATSKSK